METLSASQRIEDQDVFRYVDDRGLVRGASVEAHRIAALVAGGMTIGEVLEDFPGLETAQVEAAIAYARSNTDDQPRAFPSRTVKSRLREDGTGGLAAAFAAAREDDR